MATEGELFEDADAFVFSEAAGCGGTNDGLYVESIEGGGIIDRKVPAFSPDLRLALPHTVAPLGVEIAEAGHVELEERFEANRGGLADPRRQRDLEPLGGASTRSPGEIVVDGPHHLGWRRAVGPGDRCDEAGVVPALAVEQLVDVEVGGERAEVDRRPQPEELWVGHGSASGGALTHTADAPRPVAAAERFTGGQVVQHAVDLEPAFPATELGEAGVVERDTKPHLLEEVRFLDGRRAAHECEIGAQALVRGIHGDPQRVERLEYLDRDRADLVGVGTIGGRSTGGVDADLASCRGAAVGDDAERRVDHMTVRVQAHRRGEEQTGVLGVPVEEVTVVVVDVTRGGLGDRV